MAVTRHPTRANPIARALQVVGRARVVKDKRRREAERGQKKELRDAQ